MMNTDLPRIWAIPVSEMQVRGPFVRKIGFHPRDNATANRAAVETRFGYPDGQPLPSELVPDRVSFMYSDLDETYRADSPDWFGIASAMSMISDRFRDLLLSRFDLGTNELFEVPLYEFDQVTPRPGLCYLLHIRQTKDTLIPEGSTGLEQRGKTPGKWRLRSAHGELTVRASAAAGADIWIDLHMLGAIFVSDRLKAALTSPGLRAPGIPFRPCTVVA
jgi:hypothetical protein